MDNLAHVRPDHVPAELVVDADIYNLPGGEVDPQCAWRALQGPGPLSWSPRNGGHWTANTPEAVFRFLRDFENLSALQLSIPPVDMGDALIPNQSDPPAHGDYRRNVMAFFTSDAVDAMAPDVRELCIELIEELRPQGQCEFVMDFAFRFPLGIFLRMMGLPDADRMYLRRLSEAFTDSAEVEKKTAAALELEAYIDRAIEERIAHPRDDAITAITRFRINGRPYTRSEMRGNVRQHMAAGLDTVAGMLAFIVLHLARHPAQADHVRSCLGDEVAMHQIVQEFLRRFTIVNPSRRVSRDFTHENITLKKGDMIIMPITFFNLDENRESPEEVDFARANKRHVSFGSGPHACAGALLAREEIRIFLEEWLTRMPQVRLDPDHPPRLQALPLNQVRELRLQWDV